MSTFLQALVDAVSSGALYGLAALGIGLVFGVLRLANFAHGEIITAAAYTLVFTWQYGPFVAIPLAILASVLLALLMELVVFRWMRRASDGTLLIASFGLSVLIQRVYEIGFGNNVRTGAVAPALSGSVTVGKQTAEKTEVSQGQFKVEFRDLRQALQQDTTWVIQEACRWRLGDLRCGVDLTPYTTEGEVASVTNAYEFAITGSDIETETDHYGEGSLTWLTGSNAGTPAAKIKSYEYSVVVLSEAAPFEIEVGDTFQIVAGCRKRWEEDCKGKFDNILNFGGEKDKPTRDELAALPESS